MNQILYLHFFSVKVEFTSFSFILFQTFIIFIWKLKTSLLNFNKKKRSCLIAKGNYYSGLEKKIITGLPSDG